MHFAHLPLLTFPFNSSLISPKHLFLSTSILGFKNLPTPVIAARVFMEVGPFTAGWAACWHRSAQLGVLTGLFLLWTVANAETHNRSECRDVSDCGVLDDSVSPLTTRLRDDLGRGGDNIVREGCRELSSGQCGATAALFYHSGRVSRLAWVGGGC